MNRRISLPSSFFISCLCFSLGNEWNQANYTYKDPDGKWKLPNLYYSFYKNSSLGLIHFVIIDTEAIKTGQNLPDDQVQWLTDELRLSKGALKIVVGHHPIYTRSNLVDLQLGRKV